MGWSALDGWASSGDEADPTGGLSAPAVHIRVHVSQARVAVGRSASNLSPVLNSSSARTAQGGPLWLSKPRCDRSGVFHPSAHGLDGDPHVGRNQLPSRAVQIRNLIGNHRYAEPGAARPTLPRLWRRPEPHEAAST